MSFLCHDGDDAAEMMAGLVAAVARGELADIDPENGKFKEVFAQLAEALGSVH